MLPQRGRIFHKIFLRFPPRTGFHGGVPTRNKWTAFHFWCVQLSKKCISGSLNRYRKPPSELMCSGMHRYQPSTSASPPSSAEIFFFSLTVSLLPRGIQNLPDYGALWWDVLKKSDSAVIFCEKVIPLPAGPQSTSDVFWAPVESLKSSAHRFGCSSSLTKSLPKCQLRSRISGFLWKAFVRATRSGRMVHHRQFPDGCQKRQGGRRTNFSG